MPVPSQDALFAALATVNDPEIRKPITELGMVESVGVDESGRATVTILLTISGCPLKETLTRDATAALLTVEGVTSAAVTLGVMSDEQRAELRTNLRGGNAEREIPFAQPNSLTRVYCVASGIGWGRQVLGDRQPRCRHGPGRPEGRCRRRRRLWLLGAPHARRRTSPDPGRRYDPAAARPRR